MSFNSGSIDEIIQKRELIKHRFENLQKGEISATEFVHNINPIINELIFEQKWKDLIEKEDWDSLSKLLGNLNARTKAYNSLTDLGDDHEANTQFAKLQNVGSQIINQLSSVITIIQKENKTRDLDFSINETSKETGIEIKKLNFTGEKRFFIGRDDYVDSKIKNALIEPGSRVSLAGPGGSGKSQLAFKALHQYHEKDKIIDLVVPVYLDTYSSEVKTDPTISSITTITLRKFLND
jgi:hypothetical protein